MKDKIIKVPRNYSLNLKVVNLLEKLSIAYADEKGISPSSSRSATVEEAIIDMAKKWGVEDE